MKKYCRRTATSTQEAYNNYISILVRISFIQRDVLYQLYTHSVFSSSFYSRDKYYQTQSKCNTQVEMDENVILSIFCPVDVYHKYINIKQCFLPEQNIWQYNNWKTKTHERYCTSNIWYYWQSFISCSWLQRVIKYTNNHSV